MLYPSGKQTKPFFGLVKSEPEHYTSLGEFIYGRQFYGFTSTVLLMSSFVLCNDSRNIVIALQNPEDKPKYGWVLPIILMRVLSFMTLELTNWFFTHSSKETCASFMFTNYEVKLELTLKCILASCLLYPTILYNYIFNYVMMIKNWLYTYFQFVVLKGLHIVKVYTRQAIMLLNWLFVAKFLI